MTPFLYGIGYKSAINTRAQVVDNTNSQKNSVIQKLQDLFSEVSVESMESNESGESSELSSSEEFISVNPPLITSYNHYQLGSNEYGSQEMASLESPSLESVQEGVEDRLAKQPKQPVTNYI